MSKYEYNKEYAKEYLRKFEEIKIRVPTGEKNKIRRYAKSKNESMNGFITRVIKEVIDKGE